MATEAVEPQTILTEEEYRWALQRLGEVFGAERGTPEGDECERLADLVEAYEDIHFPMKDPTPAAAIEFRMDQANLTLDDLATCIGTRELAAAVLAGQQEVTPAMAQALYERLDIDLFDLLPAATVGTRAEV